MLEYFEIECMVVCSIRYYIVHQNCLCFNEVLMHSND